MFTSYLHTRNHLGLTLIEALVVLSIYTILMLAVIYSVTELYRTNAYAIAQAEEVENARRGMTQWNRDAKELTTGEDGNYPVAIIEPHRFGYYSDTDRDESVEYVEYELASTTLYKYTYNATGTPPTYDFSTPDSTEILSEFVNNLDQGVPTFRYFANDGTELYASSPIIEVRYIQAQIIVNIDPLRNPGEFMLRSSLAPRNLKDNL